MATTVAAYVRTPAEVLLERWMKLSLLMYAGTTLVFLFARGILRATLNASGRALGLPATPESTELFWFALTISMMAMLCAACAYVARDVRRNLNICGVIVAGKLSGAVVAALAFVLWQPYPAHITIAITDVPLGLVTLILWRRAA